jgi:hypothetical protein
LFEQKNDEKEKVNQACENHKQMFVVALSAMIIPRMTGLSIPVQCNT